MENYGIKINVVTFIFIILRVKLQNSIQAKKMTPISCYKSLLKLMFYSMIHNRKLQYRACNKSRELLVIILFRLVLKL